jgi:hypothetical protein
MSAPKPKQKRLDGSVQNTVYQTNKRGKPIMRARNRTQINRKILRHGLGAAKMLELCAGSLQNMGWANVLLGEWRIKKCSLNATGMRQNSIPLLTQTKQWLSLVQYYLTISHIMFDFVD